MASLSRRGCRIATALTSAADVHGAPTISSQLLATLTAREARVRVENDGMGVLDVSTRVHDLGYTTTDTLTILRPI